MLRRLFDMFKDDYLIEYNQYKEIIIYDPIKVKDLVFIKKYLKMYRIKYTNIIVDKWSRRKF